MAAVRKYPLSFQCDTDSNGSLELGMHMKFCTEYQTHGSNSPLIIPIKPKAKFRFRAVANVLPYILH
jgi:hypothetical protein